MMAFKFRNEGDLSLILFSDFLTQDWIKIQNSNFKIIWTFLQWDTLHFTIKFWHKGEISIGALNLTKERYLLLIFSDVKNITLKCSDHFNNV